MQDRVTVQLYKLFAEFGFGVLRFNFRGIGRSQGVFDNGMGELSDAASALDYLQSMNPNAEQCWVGGYSFGAWIGLQLLMRRPEIDGFIAVSPPANHYDLSFLAPCPASGVIIYGTRDSVTTPLGYGARDQPHPHAEEHQSRWRSRSKAPTTSIAVATRAKIISPKSKCTRATYLGAPPRRRRRVRRLRSADYSERRKAGFGPLEKPSGPFSRSHAARAAGVLRVVRCHVVRGAHAAHVRRAARRLHGARAVRAADAPHVVRRLHGARDTRAEAVGALFAAALGLSAFAATLSRTEAIAAAASAVEAAIAVHGRLTLLILLALRVVALRVQLRRWLPRLRPRTRPLRRRHRPCRRQSARCGGGHGRLHRPQQAEIVIRVLQVVFAENAIAGAGRVARELEVTLVNVRRRAAHLGLRTVLSIVRFGWLL